MSTTERPGNEPEPSTEPEASGDADEVETERRDRSSLRKKLVGAAAVGLVWGCAEATGYSVGEHILDWAYKVLPLL
jgi:hypothetical protein